MARRSVSAGRWVLHADLDAFYASVEQRDFPELRGLPVVVGGGGARGVVAAASYEARAFGVRSAMPGFQVRQLCPAAVFRKPRMDVYARVSRQVRDVFESFTPDVEPLSLDEAFLDVTGCLGNYASPRALAEALKTKVWQETTLRISVGLAPSKLVAKLACTLGKPDGLLLVAADEVRSFLAPLPVRRLWGVGPVMAQRLNELGIASVGQLAEADPQTLRLSLGDGAFALVERASGLDTSAVQSAKEAKSIGEESTFGEDIRGFERASAALTGHAEAVAHRLRSGGYLARTVTLKVKLASAAPGQAVVRDGQYPQLTRARTLREPTASGSVIRQAVLELYSALKLGPQGVRLLGCSASGLVRSDAPRQLDLFAPDHGRDKLGEVMDAIGSRFGPGAIGRAVGAPEKLTPGRRSRDK